VARTCVEEGRMYADLPAEARAAYMRPTKVGRWMLTI